MCQKMVYTLEVPSLETSGTSKEFKYDCGSEHVQCEKKNRFPNMHVRRLDASTCSPISSPESAFLLVSTKNTDSGHFQFMRIRSGNPFL